MKSFDHTIRLTAFAVAALLVSGASYALASYSDAKFAAAIASAQLPVVTDSSQTALAPVRIDVVGKRITRVAA